MEIEAKTGYTQLLATTAIGSVFLCLFFSKNARLRFLPCGIRLFSRKIYAIFARMVSFLRICAALGCLGSMWVKSMNAMKNVVDILNRSVEIINFNEITMCGSFDIKAD